MAVERKTQNKEEEEEEKDGKKRSRKRDRSVGMRPINYVLNLVNPR